MAGRGRRLGSNSPAPPARRQPGAEAAATLPYRQTRAVIRMMVAADNYLERRRGDEGQICGGHSANSIYRTGRLEADAPWRSTAVFAQSGHVHVLQHLQLGERLEQIEPRRIAFAFDQAGPEQFFGPGLGRQCGLLIDLG